MDLKSYYHKVRTVSSGLSDEFPVVVSLETPDGGKPGILTEVSRHLAAKMIVDGSVRVARAEEADAYRESQAKARLAAEQAAQSAKVHLTLLTPDDLKALRAE